MLISLLYTFAVLTILAYFIVMPRRKYNRPSSEGSDDDGGEPIGLDLPDLDLPPGISLPVSDFEPDYNKPTPRIFVREDGVLIYSWVEISTK